MHRLKAFLIKEAAWKILSIIAKSFYNYDKIKRLIKKLNKRLNKKK